MTLSNEMLIGIARPVRRWPARAALRTELERPLEVAEFHAEPGERREGVSDEPTAVAGVVIAFVGIRLLLDGTVDTDRVRHPFVFPPRAPRLFPSRGVHRRTHTQRASVASVTLRVDVGGGPPAAMEYGELGD